MSTIDDLHPLRAMVEHRDQYGAVADVRHAERIIDLIVVPYNEDTVVEHRGALVIESVLPGAFAGLEAVPERVTVNRDHDRGRPVGKALSVTTDSAAGLIASVRISKTPLGDETLELADDDVLRPSVGMNVRPRDQRWSQANTRRQVTRAFLDHIAMLPQQAYLGAKVLAVRSAPAEPGELWTPPSTPRLDAAREILARAERLRGREGA